jgi:hypothetical protein
MATLESVTSAHSRRQRLLARRVAARVAQLWRQVDLANIALSWRAQLPAALVAVSTTQATAAAGAGVYVDDALEAQGIFGDAQGLVMSQAFGGVASDGRNLMTLLNEPAIAALTALKQGQPLVRASATGLLSLDTIVRTQISDAGRSAELVAMTARKHVDGYVRMLSLPSCSRCIILAGRFYRWNQGFKRHPRCDCRHVPSSEDVAGDLTTDPKHAFESMDEAERNRVFGKAGAEAIQHGADISQVVNARRGMQEATVFGRTVKVTTEGASRRRVRLMPEQILIEAKGNRDEAIRLLRAHGYLR